MKSIAMVCLLGFLLGLGGGCGSETRGVLVLGHEVRSLQPCGDTRVFWAHVPEIELRQRLNAEYDRLTTRPYEPVFVVVEGEFVDAPRDGFAADFDGTIEIRALGSISRDGVEACQAAEAKREPAPPAASSPGDATETYVFVCGDASAYSVRIGPKGAWLFHPSGTRLLPGVPVETGRAFADAAFELRIDGQAARITEVDHEPAQCRNDPRRAVWEKAKLDGVDFRAVGNEPGWNLEILEGDRIVLVADYGAVRVERPLPPPTLDPEAAVTRFEAGDLAVTLAGRPCRDTMSGEAFETTVVVTWGERTLDGCGRALH